MRRRRLKIGSSTGPVVRDKCEPESNATGIANLNFPLAAASLLFAGMFTAAAVKVARWQPAPAVDAMTDPALQKLFRAVGHARVAAGDYEEARQEARRVGLVR